MRFSNRDIDMTEGDIGKQLIAFALPMLLGLCFQQLYTTVDTVVVGQFVSKTALAAVGCTGNIINMLVGFCNGFAIGATVVISQCYGAKDDKNLSLAVQTTIVMTFIMSVIMTAVGILIAPLALEWMNTPEDVIAEATVYLQIYFAGISGLMIYNMGSGILRAVGDSQRPLYFLIISSILNVGLDLLFVCSFGMGVEGVAYATILSQMISAVLILVLLTRSHAPYRIIWSRLRLDMPILRSISKIGFPAGIQQAVISFSNVFVQSYINAYGSDCMAGWAAYSRLDAFIVLPANSLSQASATFSAQNYGAHKYGRFKEGARVALVYSIIATVVLTAVAMLFRQPLLKLINSDPGMLSYGEHFILWISPFYALTCFNGIYSGAMRGMNDSRTPMIITISCFVIFRQIFLLVCRLLNVGFMSVTLAYPVGWVLCSVLVTLYYRKQVRLRLSE